MFKLKEILTGVLGSVGLIILQFILIVLTIIPLSFCGFPIYVNILICLALYFTNFIGGMLTIAIWIYSFIKVIALPIGVFEIIYFICLGIYVILYFIPVTLYFIFSKGSN